MKIKTLLISFGLSILVWGCEPSPKTEENPEETVEKVQEITPPDTTAAITGATYSGDNSRTSLDWNGTYFEVLPCASCEGIELWVTLNQDGTFEMKTNYLGLNDAREEIFTGNFSWDPTGSMITLEGLIGDYPGKFKVGENQLWYLDKNGARIEGDLADRYILKKK